MMHSITRVFTIVGFFVFVAAQVSLAAGYKISMLPMYSTEEINNRITPLAKYLSDETGLDITTTLTSSFDQYLKQLSSGGIDIGFENPYIYVLASKEHEVAAMALKGKDGDKFRGIIITRPGNSLYGVKDLIGKKISIVGYTSAGGYLSQKLTMLENGIDIAKECIVEEAQENKQENVIFSVYTGDVDAGFIRESALNMASDFVPAEGIRVMTGTAWLPNWALSISRRMPPEDREKIMEVLSELRADSPVLKALTIKGFRPAQDREYDSVRKAAGLD